MTHRPAHSGRCLSVAAGLGVILLLIAACAPTPSAEAETAPTVPVPTPSVLLPEVLAATAIPAEPPQETVVAEAEPAPTLEDGVSATTVSPPAVAVTYSVQPGDTLLGLAMAFDVPMAAIQLSNDMGAETTVQVDQVLKVPQEAMWAGASPFWIVHQVVAGETLSELAAQFGLDLDVLLDANGFADADLLAVGQPLILPLTGPVESVASVPLPPAVTAQDSEPPEISESATADGAIAESGAPEETPDASAPAVAPETIAPTAPAESQAPVDASALAGEIFRLLNEQRAAYGLPSLAWNGTLATAAQLHADDCYARGWCGHTGSDGATYKERIIRAGYDPVRWSECWAWYGSPEMAVAMWMDEVPPNDPHRRTILSDYLVEVGVGVVPGNGHGYYFIADFGTPR